MRFFSYKKTPLAGGVKNKGMPKFYCNLNKLSMELKNMTLRETALLSVKIFMIVSAIISPFIIAFKL